MEIDGLDPDCRVCGGHGCVGEVVGVGHVVHAEIEPDDKVFLIEGFGVEEVGEVLDGVVSVEGVPGGGRVPLGFVPAGDVEVVVAPFGGLLEV